MQDLGYVGRFSPGAFQQPLQVLGLREGEEGDEFGFGAVVRGCGCRERGVVGDV